MWLAQAQADHLLCSRSFLFGLETWNNCAYYGKLSFCYIKLQTPAVDLNYLYRWVLAESCYFIIPQVERCLDNMSRLFFFFFFFSFHGCHEKLGLNFSYQQFYSLFLLRKCAHWLKMNQNAVECLFPDLWFSVFIW